MFAVYIGPGIGEICRNFRVFDRNCAIENPDADNEVTEPQQFNLLFASSIGPTGQHPGFVWEPLVCLNSPAFRNEISPRAGLLPWPRSNTV